MRKLWIGVLVTAVVACGGGDGAEDGGHDASVSEAGSDGVCTHNGECDDGMFCTGDEQCAPDDPEADEQGCVSAGPPCADGETCDEESASCKVGCPDEDGDGHDAAHCGGDDCDDGDPGRFPGNPEVCDADGKDEDCDTSTIQSPGGDGDADNDGFIAIRCFNVEADGSENRGTDCDDSRPTINPSGVESCDGRDNDCDESTDEGVLETYYRDVDGDNFGDASMTMEDCTAPSGWVLNATDCDDRNGDVNPGAPEVCDGSIDHNCSGVVDEGCSCSAGETRECGPAEAPTGTCQLGSQTCTDGMWPSVCTDAVYPMTDVDGSPYDPCGGGDQDCDGSVDEDGTEPFYLDSDGDGHGDPAEEEHYCSGLEPADYVSSNDDCNDSNDKQSPSVVEADQPCDGLDNDCDGEVDEAGSTALSCYPDMDGDGYGATSGVVYECDSCTSGRTSTSGDCRDDIAAVNPGVTMFQTEAACASGSPVRCSSTWRCGDCEGPRATFDYNCDGTDEIAPPGDCSAAGIGVCAFVLGHDPDFDPPSYRCGTLWPHIVSCEDTVGCPTVEDSDTLRCR